MDGKIQGGQSGTSALPEVAVVGHILGKEFGLEDVWWGGAAVLQLSPQKVNADCFAVCRAGSWRTDAAKGIGKYIPCRIRWNEEGGWRSQERTWERERRASGGKEWRARILNAKWKNDGPVERETDGETKGSPGKRGSGRQPGGAAQKEEGKKVEQQTWSPRRKDPRTAGRAETLAREGREGGERD